LRIVDFWICMLGRTQTSLRKAFPASLSFIWTYTNDSVFNYTYLFGYNRLWLNYDSP
jgi:hypothetical protein